ncbi:MAG: hypothetical protein EOP92_17445, partial [Lysobacteraceae bacterium]
MTRFAPARSAAVSPIAHLSRLGLLAAALVLSAPLHAADSGWTSLFNGRVQGRAQDQGGGQQAKAGKVGNRG